MAFDEQLRHAVDVLSQRLLDDHRQAVDEAVAAVVAAQPKAPTVDVPASQRLVDGVRAIDEGRTLTEILDALAAAAAREAARVGVLLVRGDSFYGWRFLGFDPLFAGSRDPQTIEIPREDGGVITQSAHSAAAAVSDSAAPDFAELPPGRQCFAVPLAMGGQIVAMLYADQGAGELWTGTLEVLARHAARCLETLTATTAARAMTERPGPPVPSVGRGEADDEAVAQRYARLLVSEIRLYHEPQVAAGIQERDLVERLGGEIAHARSLYDQRVALAVRQRTDYFQAELVRTLANGDAGLLDAGSQS